MANQEIYSNETKYSIWVIPPEPVYSSLKEIIETLADKYDGPVFEPHMTILGNINAFPESIEEKMKELTKKFENLKLSLGPVSFSTTYFQSVFVRINSTAELMQLNIDAKKALGMENNVFMPHVSLLYGDHDMEIRAKAASEIQISPSEFIINELVITLATSNPDEWEHLLTIPIGKA